MNNAIRILIEDFEILDKNIELAKDLFLFETINNTECKLIFNNTDKGLEFDELIKDNLIYQGFDKDDNPTRLGQVCEDIIDKMHKILE